MYDYRVQRQLRLRVTTDQLIAAIPNNFPYSTRLGFKGRKPIIRWRANKQDTVTTSTTEAELLALTQAAKEALFVRRPLKQLYVIECGNTEIIKYRM
jgi:hypothetical protein